MAKIGLLRLTKIRGGSFLQMMYLNRFEGESSIIFDEVVE